MANVRVVINMQGIQELRKSSEMQSLLKERADEIVSRCSGIYDTDAYVGKTRANASIVTHDSATYHRNLKNNELLKALR